MKHLSFLHFVATLSVAFAVFQPVVDSTPVDQPTTGDLVISLVGPNGEDLAGCFTVTDADGEQVFPCSDGSGPVTVFDLAAGSVDVAQTSGPDGYELAAAGRANVPLDGTGEITLSAPASPVPSTETPIPPTAAPDAPTEAPDEGVEERPSIGIFAVGDISLDCQHGANTTTSTFEVSAEDIPGDGSFVITITPYSLTGEELAPQVFTITAPSDLPIELPNQEWRRIDVSVQFSDGSTSTAATGCNTDPLVTDLTTVPQTADDEQPIPQGGSVDLNTPIRDTATLSGQSVDASGTVMYYLYDSAGCSGDPVFTSGPKTVVDGVIPPSDPYTPTINGQYEWVVVYSGDIGEGDPTKNAHFNAGSESGCGEETVIVGQLDTTVTTAMETADGTLIPQNGSVAQGVGVKDTATLTGATATAGGTVTYTLYEGACPGTPVDGASFTVSTLR